MKLSIIVIFYNMRREAARTLHSLSLAYQQGVTQDSYEVIAIDNGSDQPLCPEDVAKFGPHFKYHFHPTESISPVQAMNHGSTLAQGDNLAFIVDGARMATPGLVGKTLTALDLAASPFVAGLSWHLGPDIQGQSMQRGYNQAAEDALLASINWPKAGYKLFTISTIAPSCKGGFLRGLPPECSWLALPRQVFDELNGYDPRFQTGGGGLVNHEFRDRAMAYHGISPVVLLGEGVFHQFHGGVATNVPTQHLPLADFKAEYQSLTGKEYKKHPHPEVIYYGNMPKSAQKFTLM